MKFQIFNTQHEKETEQFRWRLIADNGKIIANAGESYKNHADCLKMVKKIRRGLFFCRIEDSTQK